MGVDLTPVEEKRKFFLKYFKDLIIRENAKEYILRAFYAEALKRDRRGKLYVSKQTFEFYNFRPVTHYYPIFRDLSKMKSGGFRKLVFIYSRFFNRPEVMLEYDGLVGTQLPTAESIGQYTIKYKDDDQQIKETLYSKHFPFRFKMRQSDALAFDRYFESFYFIASLYKNDQFLGDGMVAKLYSLNGVGIKQTGFQVRLNNENLRFLTLKTTESDQGRMFFLRRGHLSSRTLIISEGVKELLWAMFLFRNNFSFYYASLTNNVDKTSIKKIVREFGIKQVFMICDNDEAGEEMRENIKSIFSKTRETAIMELKYSNNYKDFSDFVNDNGYGVKVELRPVV